jgi:ribonuclease Z
MTSITFLGTGGSVVSKERMCSGVLFGDKLIDVGFGVLSNLIKSGTDLELINEVYVSHTHSDHIGDFTGLIWAMAMENRVRSIRIVSSTVTAMVLEKILELQSTPRGFVKFKVGFVRPEQVGLNYMPTIHDPQNLAFRFKADGSDIVYVGDTAKFEKVGEFARGCDLMIHDATFLEGQESIAKLTNHSTASEAAGIARLAQAKRLVLTHISPSNGNAENRYLAEAASMFDGEIVVARDRQTIRL